MSSEKDPKLLPKVSTVTGSLEGYEASNLISENPLIKSRGFLAYSCIKPPIDIDFELICPIRIDYIGICCKIGSQRIVGIELQARNTSMEYTTIAHGYFNEDYATFCNSHSYSRSNPPKTGNVHLGFFKAHLFRIFTNTKHVRVRILRTERSTPCLGPVEIWGKVAKSCPKTTVETVRKLISKHNQVETLPPPITSNNTICDFEISDDFKDALTCEVMAIPMTLPSGHSVDQSTLERCAANDAMYGRKCCDPFTGLPFTENRKPKLNVALKNRIDMFLLRNAHRKETFGVSRTVGKKYKYEGQGCRVINHKIQVTGRIVTDSITHFPKDKDKSDNRYSSVFKKHKNSHNADGVLNYNPSFTVINNTNINTASCSKSNNPNNKLVINCNKSVDDLDAAISKVINSSGFVTFTKKQEDGGAGKDDADKLAINCNNNADDLDAAIAKVINSSGFVTFTKEQEGVGAEEIADKCCVCANSNNLYGLPCAHFYCKPCMLDACKTLICKECGTGFCRDDVKKVHS